MKTILFSSIFSTFCLILSVNSFAQTTISGSFDFGGITRSYSYYVPASYIPGEAVPLVLNLHGLGTDGTYQAQNRDFRPIADTANFIVVHPDGSTLFGQHFWNYGNILGSTVDDVGFLEALIDTIASHYTINDQRIYSAGVSNGSFMCYYLACESDRFAAIGAVTGSMSVEMYNECNPSYPTPVIHIHGTDDNINPYEGTSTMTGIDETIQFWVNQNSCNVVPVITPVPNSNTTDNATATHYLFYGGINNHSVELFKVTGGGHSWPGSPITGSSEVTCMDFDATKELWRFFSQYERATLSILEEIGTENVAIYPNPTNNSVKVNLPSKTQVVSYSLFTSEGKRVQNGNIQDVLNFDLDLSGEELGMYFLHVLIDGKKSVIKIIKQ